MRECFRPIPWTFVSPRPQRGDTMPRVPQRQGMQGRDPAM
jgi:hypothetical protein